MKIMYRQKETGIFHRLFRMKAFSNVRNFSEICRFDAENQRNLGVYRINWFNTKCHWRLRRN